MVQKGRIAICEYISTGINFVDDIKARGYEPVLVEGHYVGKEEEVAEFREMRSKANAGMSDLKIVRENPDYNEVLRQLKELKPLYVIAGSEFGVPLATRLAEDLGLPGNPVSAIPSMTEKDAMQEALRRNGLRYIRGKIITSEKEAEEYYRELGTEDVVVKRARGAGTQGVYLCHGHDEMINAVRTSLSDTIENEEGEVAILMQERIIGTEYIVNTVSCNGRHHVTSMWKYDKVRMPNGTNAYNNAMTIPRLEIGHSELVRYACSVATAVGVKYGPIHGEYMIDEKGPVLIEVNCRPMGAGLERKYIEQIFGHHETDLALDSYLDPVRFEEEMHKPYRVNKFGALKFFIMSSDTDVYSAPVMQIAKNLKSYYSSRFDLMGRNLTLKETHDLETAGGSVFLLHEDEKLVREECELLHLLETKYPRILYQSIFMDDESTRIVPDIDKVMETGHCHGSTLIFSDTSTVINGGTVVDSESIEDAYDSYEQGILDLSTGASYKDLESVVQMIFLFASKIRPGGRVIVPESTYCHLPYGMQGMEILMKVAGLNIELPTGEDGALLIASV